MKSFKDFIYLQEQGLQPPSVPAANQQKWKASKEEIIQYWQSLRPDTPILMKPIQYSHKGSTYGEDGLRLTGSPQFIASVLARLKEFLNYETPQAKLSLTYRETDSPSQQAMGQQKTSYVFYIAARMRGDRNSTLKR